MQKKLSIVDLLDFGQILYVGVAGMTLIWSYHYDWEFFVVSAISFSMLKIIAIAETVLNEAQEKSKQPVKEETTSIMRYFLHLLCSERFNFKKNQNSTLFLATIAFIIYQEIHIWNSLFGSSQQLPNVITHTSTQQILLSELNTSSMNDASQNQNLTPLGYPQQSMPSVDELNLAILGFLQIFQALVGIFLKSACGLYILSSSGNIPLKKINFLQLLSIFLGITALQGLFGLLWKNDQMYLVKLLLVFKVANIILQDVIFRWKKLPFFGCTSDQSLVVLIFAGAIQMFNFPIDYAPFLSDEMEQADIKKVQINTQLSLSIIRFSQTIETIFLLCASLLLNTTIQGVHFTFFLYFCQLAAISSICLSCVYIKNKLSEIVIQNYKYLFKQSATSRELLSILEDSQQLLYFVVHEIADELMLQEDVNLQKSIFAQLLRQTFVNSQIYPSPSMVSLKISSIASNLEHWRKALRFESASLFRQIFLEQVAECSQTLPLCTFSVKNKDILPFQFGKALCQRIFAEGVSSKVDSFLEIQDEQLKDQGETITEKFKRDFMSVIVFGKCLDSILWTNPRQVIHDLWFEE